MNPSWRKPFGMGMILTLILVWAVLVASASHWIGQTPQAVQLLIYAVAGIIWILPLKPLLKWMETGKWRE